MTIGIGKTVPFQQVYKPFSLLDSDLAPARDSGPDFAAFFRSALQQVNSLQHQAKQAEVALATGSDELSLHQVMVVTEQARLALDFTMAVRNKIMDAYTEIMRMQI